MALAHSLVASNTATEDASGRYECRVRATFIDELLRRSISLLSHLHSCAIIRHSFLAALLYQHTVTVFFAHCWSTVTSSCWYPAPFIFYKKPTLFPQYISDSFRAGGVGACCHVAIPSHVCIPIAQVLLCHCGRAIGHAHL